MLSQRENLPIKTIKFTQYEVESKMQDCLKFGDEALIAEICGCSATIVSQMCNPHDERKSDFYKAAKFIAAETLVSAERGLALLRLLVRLVEMHLPEDKHLCSRRETRKLLNEWTEYLDAAISGKALEVQIGELDDVIGQAQVLKRAKQEELKDEIKEQIFAN